MSESMLFIFGAAFCSVAIAGWNWVNHSAPTAGRVERRRKAFLRARALYAAEAAALHAYHEVIGSVKAQQHAAELLGEARHIVRE